jgi:hypothetical protein
MLIGDRPQVDGFLSADEAPLSAVGFSELGGTEQKIWGEVKPCTTRSVGGFTACRCCRRRWRRCSMGEVAQRWLWGGGSPVPGLA